MCGESSRSVVLAEQSILCPFVSFLCSQNNPGRRSSFMPICLLLSKYSSIFVSVCVCVHMQKTYIEEATDPGRAVTSLVCIPSFPVDYFHCTHTTHTNQTLEMLPKIYIQDLGLDCKVPRDVSWWFRKLKRGKVKMGKETIQETDSLAKKNQANFG